MAGSIRIGIIRILGRQSGLLNTQNTLPAALSQKCYISGKTLRAVKPPVKPKPYPYKDKKYGIIQALFDKTRKRIDENSKVICVDGPIAVGKTQFAKELAEELEMLHVPDATLDMMFINRYGYDMRQLDPELPELCRTFDVKNFCANPKHELVAQFQIRMYMMRCSQYIDAMAHLLSTGQGVVIERSPYSDFVFLETMFKHGYISKLARSAYYDIRENTIHELLRPHLVIYLDSPVKTIQERITARKIDYECNSKVFSDQYLADMERIYKQQFLKNISSHSEILVYDWSSGGETEVVVEDIERIDFAQFELDPYNKKMKDWRLPLEWDWCEQRMKFCNEKHVMMNYFNVPLYDVPELVRDAESGKIWRDIWFNAPGMKFTYGYNQDMGDKDLLFKTKLSIRDGL